MIGCRPLTGSEITALSCAFRGRWEMRNRALLFLGINTGFRITELLSLRRRDLLSEEGVLRESITVSRKNMKGKLAGRTVKLNRGACIVLMRWLNEQEVLHGAEADRYVFHSKNGRGKAIQRIQAWRIIKRAARTAGLKGKIATHTMRKTFGRRIYEHFIARVRAGETIDPLRYTSKTMGHRRIETTERYLDFRGESCDQAVDAISVP